MADEVRPKALMIPLDKIPLLELLEPEQFKRVVVSMSVYIADGTTPEGFEPIEKMAFESLRPFMDENIKTYQRTIEANRQNGRKGGRPKKPTETDGFSEKPTETDGVPKETHENQSTKYKVQSTKITDTNVSIIEANASKSEPKSKPDVFAEFANGDNELLDALHDFETMRKQIKKPMTERAKALLCNKLKSDYSPADWVRALDQSIENSWQGLYPLKDDKPKQQSGSSSYDVHGALERALKNIDEEYGVI